MEITYHLSQFDGPLDMLLFMLEKSRIDIRDIFISEITDQYIQAVKGAPDLDMEEASAFIAVAARLLEIKSHKLLPQPEPETDEDPEAAFIRQLEEYAAFKQIAQDRLLKKQQPLSIISCRKSIRCLRLPMRSPALHWTD